VTVTAYAYVPGASSRVREAKPTCAFLLKIRLMRIAIGFASWFQRIGMCDGRWRLRLSRQCCALKGITLRPSSNRVRRLASRLLHASSLTLVTMWYVQSKVVSGLRWIMRARWGLHATVRVLASVLGPLGLVQAAENGEHAHTKAARDNIQHPNQPELRNRTRPECVTRRPRPLLPTACTQASAPATPARRHRYARAQVYVAGLNEDAFAIGTTGVVIPAPLDGGSNVWIAKWCVRTAAAPWCPRARPVYGGLLRTSGGRSEASFHWAHPCHICITARLLHICPQTLPLALGVGVRILGRAL
jgi:hypothetical protein